MIHIFNVLNNSFVLCFSPSKMALEQLAKHLVLQYPKLGDPRRADKGWEMWFFHSVFEKAATGFLEERLKSQRRKLVPVKPQKTTVVMREDSLDWDSEEEEGKKYKIILF
jgi:hypothetical protein